MLPILANVIMRSGMRMGLPITWDQSHRGNQPA
jgi:hypothetical protein